MKTGELAEWLNIAAVTVRLWTKEYGEFLSPTARAGGHTRVFSDQDARIMGVIATMKAEGQARDTIIASLKSLQADDWRNLSPLPNPPPNVSAPVQMMPTSTAETAIDQQRRGMMREITLLEDRIDTLQDELKSERGNKAALQVELTAATARAAELGGKLAERPAARFWLAVLAVAVVLAVVITAILLLAGRGV